MHGEGAYKDEEKPEKAEDKKWSKLVINLEFILHIFNTYELKLWISDLRNMQ